MRTDLSKTCEQFWLHSDADTNGFRPLKNPISAQTFISPDALFPARRTVKVGILPTGRVGEFSVGLGRADVPCYTSNAKTLTGDESDVVYVTVSVPHHEDESLEKEVQVFVSHLAFYPAQLSAEEIAEERRINRINAEVSHWGSMNQDPDRMRTNARQLVRAVWDAVEDLSKVTPHTHPEDVVEKHLQRGNIERDGKWGLADVPLNNDEIDALKKWLREEEHATTLRIPDWGPFLSAAFKLLRAVIPHYEVKS